MDRLSIALDELNISDYSIKDANKTKDDEEDAEWEYNPSTKEYTHVKNPDFSIPKKLYKKLFKHQKVGVAWLSALYLNNIGGILGDDMGLGKTYQTLSYIGGLMLNESIRNAICVVPVSLLRTWEEEANTILKMCVPEVTIIVITSSQSANRRYDLLYDAISCCASYPYFVITTYGLISNNPQSIIPQSNYNTREYHWDFVILDEGHQIKNRKTKKHIACKTICKENKTKRLLLTGTPIQNNLEEMWSLFDWSTEGRLLGDLNSFKNEFAFPIQEGRHKDASDTDIKNASKANDQLQKLLKRNFLQRTKKDTFSSSTEETDTHENTLPKKNDVVVWTHLSSKQRTLYETYLQEDNNVRSVISGETKSPLIAVTWLKKLCGHPNLALPTDSYDFNEDEDSMIQDSAKLQALLSLVQDLLSRGHRILIFSQSTKMLDIIQSILNPITALRIDGSTKERDRQCIVNTFNKRKADADIMLLSTKAGGLGLTLTGADTAIIYDPSWNPAEDSQAVDRCYRIGQKKNVTIYRLITAGTVEERMYEKQIFKDGIRRTVLTSSGSATERHFDKQDLRRLFTLAPHGVCEMLDKVSPSADFDVDSFSFLMSHDSILGISPHDALYTSIMNNIDNDCNDNTLFNGKWISKGETDGISYKPSLHDNASYSIKGKAGRVMHSINDNIEDDDVILLGKGFKNKTRLAREKAKSKYINDSSSSDDDNSAHSICDKENIRPKSATNRKSIIDLCDTSDEESDYQSDDDDQEDSHDDTSEEENDQHDAEDDSEDKVGPEKDVALDRELHAKNGDDSSCVTSEAEFTLDDRSSNQDDDSSIESENESHSVRSSDYGSETNSTVPLIDKTKDLASSFMQIEIEEKNEQNESEEISGDEFKLENKSGLDNDVPSAEAGNTVNNDPSNDAASTDSNKINLDDTFVLKNSFASSEDNGSMSLNYDADEYSIKRDFDSDFIDNELPRDEVDAKKENVLYECDCDDENSKAVENLGTSCQTHCSDGQENEEIEGIGKHPSLSSVELFIEVSRLRENGENEQAMKLLLDQLDNIESIDKSDKVQLHAVIASTANELQWL